MFYCISSPIFWRLLHQSWNNENKRIKEAILHFKFKNPWWKQKTFVQIYYFLVLRQGRTPCNGKWKKRETMWTGMMSSSRDDQALSKPELFVTISWEMPGTGAISAHHLVSIPMNGMHCLDWTAARISFCSHWWGSPIDSCHQGVCLSSRRAEALILFRL